MNELDLILDRVDIILISKQVNSIRQFRIQGYKILCRGGDRRSNYIDLLILMYHSCLRNCRRKECIIGETSKILQEFSEYSIRKLYQNS